MKLTRKEAFQLSIDKWTEIVENDGVENVDILRKYEFLDNGCGLCEKYLHASNEALKYCAKCPIRPKVNDYNDLEDSGCAQECHPFYKCENQTKENAQAVLDLIISKM